MQFITADDAWLNRSPVRLHLLAGSALLGSLAFLAPTVGTAATLDLQGTSTTLPRTGYFNNQPYLNGADNVTNNGAFYGFYGSAATLTEGGGPAGTIHSGVISDGTVSPSGQANTTAVVHSGGFVTFTGANTYSGGTTIGGGTLGVGNSGALGTGGLTVNAGTLQAGADNLALGNAVTLSGNAAVDTQADRLTLSGAIVGNGSLTKIGSGTLAPTDYNTYGGGTVIQGGTVEVSTSYYDPQTAATLRSARQQPSTHQDLPDSVTLVNNGGTIASSVGYGPITLDGGALRLAGQADSLANQFRIGPGGGTLDSGGQNAPVLHGGFVDASGGTGPLVFTNTGAGRTPGVDYDFFLFRSSTFTGGSTVADNTYVMSDSNNAIGTGRLQVNAGGTFDLGAFNQTVTGLSGSGRIIASGYADLGLTGILTAQSGGFAGVLADGTNTDTYTNVTSHGLLALTKASDRTSSGGTLALSGTSTYSGATTVSAGTLQAGSTTGFSPNSAFSVAGGATLDLNAFSSTVGSLAGAGTVTNSGGAATLTTGGNNGSTTFSGTLFDGAGPLALAKTGSGTMTLSSANGYTGGTFLNAGTLAIGNSNALGAGALTFNGGTLQAAANGLTVVNAATLAANGTIDTQGNTLTFGRAITGPGGLTKTGSGTLNLAAANSYTGLTTVSSGTLQVAPGASVTSPLSNAGTVNSAGTWTGAVNANTGFIRINANGIWNGAVVTNAGTIGNGGTWNGDVQASTGSIGNSGRWTGNVASNGGTIGNVGLWTGNVQANTGSIGNGGTWAGSIANSPGGTVTEAGTIAGGVTNAGTFNMIGGATASTGGGASTAVINGPVGNSGTFNVTGPTTVNSSTFYPVPSSEAGSYASNGISRAGSGFDNTGALNVMAGGSFTIAGLLNNEAAGQITNAGTLALSAQPLQNAGTFSTQSGSTFSGGLSNTGTVNAAGGAINGAITNAGAFTVSGAVTSDSGFENRNTLTITGSGNYRIDGNLQNDSGAQVNVAAGGVLTDDLFNAGTVNNAGTYNANVTNQSGGLITNDGTWNGTLTNSAGASVNNNGTWNGDVTNIGAITNTGVFNSTNFTNTGTLTSTGAGRVNATNLTNGGTIDLSGSTVGNALSGDTYVGNPGSRIIVGVDLRSQSVSATGGQATLVTFNSASGTTNLVFANRGSQAAIAYYPTIPVVNVRSGNGNAVFVADPNSLAGLSNGLVSYSFAGGALNGTLVGTLNTPAAAAAGVQTTTVLTTLNSNFFQDWQPFERQAFITGVQDAAPNSLAGGPWIRGKYGVENDDAVVTASGVGTRARASTEFSGFQVGGDIGVFNIDKTGWNFIAGVTGGEFFATSREELGGTTRGNFEIPFVGAYAALTRGPFLIDVLYHHDFYGLKLSDAPSGLSNQGLSGNGDSVHVESAYTVALGDYGQFGNLFLSPQGSIIFSRVSLDALPFTALNLGTVKFNDIDSVLGRVGFRFGSNFQTPTLALQPFVQASVWHEFEGNSLSEFDASSGVVVPMSVSRVGTFGQFGLGLNGELLGKNLLGSIRGDFRIGDNTSGESVTAQLRYQF